MNFGIRLFVGSICVIIKLLISINYMVENFSNYKNEKQESLDWEDEYPKDEFGNGFEETNEAPDWETEYANYLNWGENKEKSLSKSEEEKIFEKYLSPMDKEVLLTGLSKLKKILETAQELPKAVVFLETSARPLFYAIAPLLDLIYKKRGQPKPQIAFITPHKNIWKIEDLLERIAELKKQKQDPLNSDRIEDAKRMLNDGYSFSRGTALRDAVLSLLQGEIEELEMSIKNIGYSLDELPTKNLERIAEQNLDRQFDVLQYKTKVTLGSQLLFVDDYLNKGSSIVTLREALYWHDLESSNIFIFAANRDLGDTERQKLSGLNIEIGKYLSPGSYTGFRYRASGRFNPFETWEEKEKAATYTGTRKNIAQLTTSRVSPTNTTRAELRSVLKKVGLEFIKTIK